MGRASAASGKTRASAIDERATRGVRHVAITPGDDRVHLRLGQAAWHHAQDQTSRHHACRRRLHVQSDRLQLDPHPETEGCVAVPAAGPRKRNEDFAGAVFGPELPEPRWDVVPAIADGIGDARAAARRRRSRCADSWMDFAIRPRPWKCGAPPRFSEANPTRLVAGNALSHPRRSYFRAVSPGIAISILQLATMMGEIATGARRKDHRKLPGFR